MYTIMRALLIFIPIILAAQDVGVKFECEFRRADIVKGLIQYYDTDHDSCLTVEEMKAATDKCLTWYEKLSVVAFSSGETPDTLMQRCDMDGDKRVCASDFETTNEHCLMYENENALLNDMEARSCLCTCHALTSTHEYFLDRAPCDSD